jgi:hypothetical protein
MPESIPRLRVLRHRLRIRHEDPLTRELSIEVTLHNDHDDPADEVVLTEDTYRPGLRIFDSDGSELALLPNVVIREILSDSENPEAPKLLRALNRRDAYVYWVVFSGSRAIESHGTRVIRLVWTESRQHDFPWGFGMRLFFNIPAYEVEETVPPTADHPHFVTIYPPPDHRLVVEEHTAEVLGETGSRDLTEKDHYHIGAWGPILDVSVPSVANHTVHVRTVYGVYPDRNESLLLAVIVLGLVLLSSAFFISMVLWAGDPGIYGKAAFRSAMKVLAGDATLIGTAIVAICAGFVGLASGPVFHRAKWWAMAGGAVAALGILAASF